MSREKNFEKNYIARMKRINANIAEGRISLEEGCLLCACNSHLEAIHRATFVIADRLDRILDADLQLRTLIAGFGLITIAHLDDISILTRANGLLLDVWSLASVRIADPVSAEIRDRFGPIFGGSREWVDRLNEPAVSAVFNAARSARALTSENFGRVLAAGLTKRAGFQSKPAMLAADYRHLLLARERFKFRFRDGREIDAIGPST